MKFAIHPVAGRMPGYMNVLPAEAALVIGANDVENPVARPDKTRPIYGMPILNADKAQNVIVIKRGKGAGYSGIENALFFEDCCRLCYGSAQGG